MARAVVIGRKQRQESSERRAYQNYIDEASKQRDEAIVAQLAAEKELEQAKQVILDERMQREAERRSHEAELSAVAQRHGVELTRCENLFKHEKAEVERLHGVVRSLAAPIPMRIICPECGELHVDEGEFETKPHHTHSCQHCGLTWRPAVANTVGVRFLPGFKNK